MTDPDQSRLWSHAIENEDWDEAERLQDIEAHERLGEVYLRYFETHPEAYWVMVGDKTGKVYGGGTDAYLPGEEAFTALEQFVGEKVHLFGRPVEIGLDGATPIFPED